MKKLLNILISGDLRDAGIRFHTMQAAYKYGVRGTVRYIEDYSIFIIAEGEEDKLNNFVNWCKRGPLGVRVDKVEIEEGEIKNYKKFDMVRRSRSKNNPK
ncbi:MAG: acylphosphatase [Bacteroidales bacterium]|nr:acylphosphatase [Bacteroidales bacterium]